MCRSAECIHHMQDKAAEFHKGEARRYKPVLGRRKRRSSDPIWERRAASGSKSSQRTRMQSWRMEGTPFTTIGKRWETTPGPPRGPSSSNTLTTKDSPPVQEELGETDRATTISQQSEAEVAAVSVNDKPDGQTLGHGALEGAFQALALVDGGSQLNLISPQISSTSSGFHGGTEEART